jgi:NADH-quinone oxidoreductase subunit L
MFHLITHAFFKALLFLGAGSVIHGCNGEQDIRKMGGLNRLMPVTFATYSVGMLALSGFPLLFSGFWSKDGILHAAHLWSISQAPYAIGVIAALLTAFYMTRQMFYVFAGTYRNTAQTAGLAHHSSARPAESPTVMTAPLVILAACAMLLGIVGTPAWPWLQSFLDQVPATFVPSALLEKDVLSVMLLSSFIAISGIALGWWLYGRKPLPSTDVLADIQPALFNTVAAGLYVDALYNRTIVRLTWASAAASAWLERYVWRGGVRLVRSVFLGLAWIDNASETHLLNGAFDGGCERVRQGGRLMAAMQNGLVQTYLKIVGVAVVTLGLLLIWGAHR